MRKLTETASRQSLAIVSVFIALVCSLPHLGVIVAALGGSVETLSHLARTVLGQYTATTLALVALVSTGTFVIGTGTAWLVTKTAFPGRRWLEIALVIPLAGSVELDGIRNGSGECGWAPSLAIADFSDSGITLVTRPAG